MKCLVVVQVEGCAVLSSLTNEVRDMDQMAGTRVYITPLPDFTSILFSFCR